MKKGFIWVGLCAVLFSACCNKNTCIISNDDTIMGYAKVELKPDLSKFSETEKQMLAYLCDAADIMDDLFWKEAYNGDKKALLEGIKNDTLRKFAVINYGPWDRLDGNKPFLPNVEPKPAGANFYPADMTKEEFEAFEDPNKTSLYTLIRRDENGKLVAVWYHEAFKEEVEAAAVLLEKAAELAEDEGFKNYLNLRAKAFRTDDYLESDMAWMDVKTAKFDFIVGPIENYEDGLYGYKAAHESFLLIKDMDWSKKLVKFAAMLPGLQKNLPVAPEYKKEMPGLESDMNVYEAILYRGDCNAGGKTIAINLPNDERVHISKGTRKLQLKNAMQAKFIKILLPISDVVIDPEQRQFIKFNSFFENVTFHEVAHGMGVKNTINNKGTVRQALKETYSTIEEVKADIMGLYLVDQLNQMGELTEGTVEENYLTFFAGIFRSVRFGAASAHGKANMLCFNYYAKEGVFTRTAEGVYTVDIDKMKKATTSLMAAILKAQAEGDYEFCKKWIAEESIVKPDLQADLAKIAKANIAKDIYFVQGKDVLGL